MRAIRTTFLVSCFCAIAKIVLVAAPAGYVIEWGWNTATGIAAPPKQVLSNAVAITAGRYHRLALRADGTVVQWCVNSRGEPEFGNMVLTGGEAWNGNTRLASTTKIVTNGVVEINGVVLGDVISIAAGDGFGLALKNDGTVVTWGENYVPKGLSNVVAIAADYAHSWALKRDGTVVGWYREMSRSYGLLTPDNLSNVAAIAVGPAPHGGTHGLALQRDGTVRHWGYGAEHKEATPPAGLSNVVAVAAGALHFLALRRDGTVVGWGWNKVGQATGTPTTNSPNGLNFFSSGVVGIRGQVLSNVVSIAAGRGYSLALKNDGTVVAWGRMVNDLYPVTVPEGLSNVVAIAAGEDFCLAITTNSVVAGRFQQK
jgi:alpha-tubulin suppressor-like RCC1 family protein